MSRSQCSSSFCNSSCHRSSISSRGGGSMGVGIIPICNCGELAVVKMARTSKNAGRYFWGCRNYKSGNGVMCCNYFKWCNEEKVDERDVIIGSQRRKICEMEKRLSALTRRNHFLVAVICVLSVVVCVLSVCSVYF